MFSNRSVSVQPSDAPSEYAFVPDDLSVWAFFRRLYAGLLEERDVVPDGRLVGRLEEHPVALAVHLGHVRRVLGEVLVDRVVGEVDRLQGALLDEVTHEAGLRDRRQVGRVPPGNRC
jgi:hypothetical protein